PQSRGCLDPARGITAPSVLGVLRNIGCSAAVFAAERQALKEAQADEKNGRQPADRCKLRQQADCECCKAHDHDSDEKGILSPDEIADPPEYDRSEGAYQETGSIGRKR